MKRRRLVRLLGAGVLGGLAGCTGGGGDSAATPRSTAALDTPTPEPSPAPFEHPGTLSETFETNGDFPPDEYPADGYPPAFPDPPPAPDVDPSTFETLSVNGESVGLAPIDVVIDWYRRGEARFVDARGLDQYVRAHVYGAVLSTAQEASMGGPIEGWEPGARVITYCGCPHHLSSIRAAGLKKAGFERVYALDEGVVEWGRDRAYPMAGTYWVGGTPTSQAAVTIEGVTDRAHAGEYAWAIADDRYEAAPIDERGHYAIHVRFPDASGATPLTVRTPGYTLSGRLDELASATLRPP